MKPMTVRWILFLFIICGPFVYNQLIKYTFILNISQCKSFLKSTLNLLLPQ